MTSKVLNFIWLNLDIPPPPDPADGSILLPMPLEYIGNVRAAAEAHSGVEIDLWVDSRRLTPKQLKFLRTAVGQDMPNAHVKDLRDIAEYNSQELFDRPETNPDWRDNANNKYKSVIWLQVDVAKILISLQGDFVQHFFADFDHYHVDIESPDIQDKLAKRGLVIGTKHKYSDEAENQFWGFTGKRSGFFEKYFWEALEDACKHQKNGFEALCYLLAYLQLDENMERSDIAVHIDGKGTLHAGQPGHQWSGDKSAAAPETVSERDLTAIFNGASVNDVLHLIRADEEEAVQEKKPEAVAIDPVPDELPSSYTYSAPPVPPHDYIPQNFTFPPEACKAICETLAGFGFVQKNGTQIAAAKAPRKVLKPS